jgi:hypothetical protein
VDLNPSPSDPLKLHQLAHLENVGKGMKNHHDYGKYAMCELPGGGTLRMWLTSGHLQRMLEDQTRGNSVFCMMCGTGFAVSKKDPVPGGLCVDHAREEKLVVEGAGAGLGLGAVACWICRAPCNNLYMPVFRKAAVPSVDATIEGAFQIIPSKVDDKTLPTERAAQPPLGGTRKKPTIPIRKRHNWCISVPYNFHASASGHLEEARTWGKKRGLLLSDVSGGADDWVEGLIVGDDVEAQFGTDDAEQWCMGKLTAVNAADMTCDVTYEDGATEEKKPFARVRPRGWHAAVRAAVATKKKNKKEKKAPKKKQAVVAKKKSKTKKAASKKKRRRESSEDEEYDSDLEAAHEATKTLTGMYTR